jgi:hypothetical protein
MCTTSGAQIFLAIASVETSLSIPAQAETFFSCAPSPSQMRPIYFDQLIPAMNQITNLAKHHIVGYYC